MLHESTEKKFRFTFRRTVLVFITQENRVEKTGLKNNMINFLSANTRDNEIPSGHYIPIYGPILHIPIYGQNLQFCTCILHEKLYRAF